MGLGYQFEYKCGYSFTPFLGYGFMFFKQYYDTRDAAMEGAFGEELKTFFAEHPEGDIDAEQVVVRCEKCGQYECVPNLFMYLPLDEKLECVNSEDLQENYKLYAKYRHKCKSCGGDRENISETDLRKNGIICPVCGNHIKGDHGILWD